MVNGIEVALTNRPGLPNSIRVRNAMYHMDGYDPTLNILYDAMHSIAGVIAGILLLLSSASRLSADILRYELTANRRWLPPPSQNPVGTTGRAQGRAGPSGSVATAAGAARAAGSARQHQGESQQQQGGSTSAAPQGINSARDGRRGGGQGRADAAGGAATSAVLDVARARAAVPFPLTATNIELFENRLKILRQVSPAGIRNSIFARPLTDPSNSSAHHQFVIAGPIGK